jgi:PAS domain S-box-containing protein
VASPAPSPLIRRSRRLAAIGLGVTLALLAAVDWVTILAFRWTLESGDLSRNTVRVLAQIETVMGSITDLETGQRGFVLTGQPAYLEPYEDGLKRLPGEMGRLRQLTEDNPRQQQRLDGLDGLVKAKLDEIRDTIDIRRSRGLKAAIAAVGGNSGKHAMDQIRAIVAELEGEERSLLASRLGERSERRRRTTRLVVLGSLLAAAAVIASAIAVLRQVTRREHAEHARRESEQRLAVTLSSIGDAVIATDTQGAVMFMNAIAEGLTGWRLADARRRPLEEVFVIVNEETRATVPHPVSKVLRDGHIVGLANHTMLIARDGREIAIDDSAAPIRDAGGEIMGVVLVFRDVRERKEAEHTRERFLRADAANRAKDEFLAVLSHELRNPLNAMLGWIRLLRRTNGDPTTLARAIDVLERNVRTQTTLINELLDVSRIISGKLKLELAPVNAVTVVAQAVDSMRLAAQAKGLSLRYEPPADAVLGVVADKDRIAQALANVLHNAVKFTPEGGHIDVRLTSRDGAVHVTVRDDGEGIARSFLPHLFERFRQADTSVTARDHGGLGLGLAIVKHVVDRHGGTVQAESAGKGLGATFTITLPLAADQTASRDTTVEAAIPQLPARVSVLLIEDDADTLEALTYALEDSGARVFPARSVPDALAIFDREHPTVIVSDISMPGGDGYAFIREVRDRDDGRTPAVAMTGLASQEDRSAALRAGFDEHVAKPVDPDTLIRSVRALALARGTDLGVG